MKLLVDNAVSPKVSHGLQSKGYDCRHVRDINLQNATDEEIFIRAEEEGRVLISADTDFGALLAIRRKQSPSFILFRKTTGLRPEHLTSQLLHVLKKYSDDIEKGSIIVITDMHVRVRSLPIG